MKKIYKQHGDGIHDPDLVVEYDPKFKGILGSGVNRREMLEMGGLAALGSAMPSVTFAKEDKNWDPTVRIGYIPITDAAALLIAHELGLFKKQGIPSVRPTLNTWLVTSWLKALPPTALILHIC